MTDMIQPGAAAIVELTDRIRVLTICENESDRDLLKNVFRKAGLTSESTSSLTAGCESAKSGRFEVVFCSPFLQDGSWKRLIDVADHYGLSFEVILLAQTFDLSQWAEALQVGAFDVLDVVCDLPKAAEAAKRAFGTAYLKRFRSCPEQV
jgi:DNA-binding NtrC family response regulator